MNERKRVVCFGELLIRLASPGRELLLQTPRLEVNVGGAEANVAVSLARFGHDAAVATIVADNALGRAAVAELKRYGVDTANVMPRPGRMGLYFYTAGATLRPSSVLYDRTGSAFALAPLEAIDWQRVLAGAAWLHVSGITPALGAAAAAACARAVETAVQLGVAVSFDGNYREQLWNERRAEAPALLRNLLGQARIAFVDDRDVALILGREFPDSDGFVRRRDAAAAAFAAFPNLQAIHSTLRDVRGVDHHELCAATFTRDAELRSKIHRLTGIVDRIGSGDAFAAGILHGQLEGLDDRRSLELATAAAALKHSIPGDFNLLGLADIERVLGPRPLDVDR